jgi:hypothetical protein
MKRTLLLSIMLLLTSNLPISPSGEIQQPGGKLPNPKDDEEMS